MMVVAAHDDVIRLKAQVEFSEQRMKQLEDEEVKEKLLQDKLALALKEVKKLNVLDLEAKATRSEIAEANRERLQLMQDEADAEKIRAHAAGKAQRARDEEAQRMSMVEKAQAAAANMQHQRKQKAMPRPLRENRIF